MTESSPRTEPEAAGLRHALQVSAELPAPPDLAGRVLDRPQFTGTRSTRAGRRAGTPVRRTWAVAGAAASVAAVVIGVAVFGGSAATTGPVTPPAAGPAPVPSQQVPRATDPVTAAQSPMLLPRGDYQAWAAQTVPCGGAPAVSDTAQQLLRPGVEVVEALVCDTAEQDRPGDGRWLMAGERDLTATQTSALVTALTAEDVRPDPAGVCDAMAVLVPDFALVLADGRTVRPGVPGDGCHPSREVATLLAPDGDPQSIATTPIRQLRSPAMLDAGCEPASTPYWDPFSSGGTGSTGSRPKLPGAASVCRYAVTGSAPESLRASLVALGTPSRGELTTALGPILDARVKPTAVCTAEANAFRPAETGWLTVVGPAPVSDGTDAGDGVDAPGSAPSVLSVELGGCHRVLAADGVGWFAPGTAVDALAALADQPVTLK